MGIGNLISKAFLTILLAVTIFAFVVLSSSLGYVSEENLDSVISGVGADVVGEQVFRDAENNEINEEELYITFAQECSGKETIVVDGPGIVLNCTEVQEAGPEGIGEILRRELEKKIQEEVTAQVTSQDLSLPFKIARGLMFGVLVVLIILLVILFLTSTPKSDFFISAGIAALIAGAAGFVIRSLDLSNLQGELMLFVDTIDFFLAGVARTLLYVFFAGVALVVFGIVSKFVYKPEEKKTETKEKKK